MKHVPCVVHHWLTAISCCGQRSGPVVIKRWIFSIGISHPHSTNIVNPCKHALMINHDCAKARQVVCLRDPNTADGGWISESWHKAIQLDSKNKCSHPDEAPKQAYLNAPILRSEHQWDAKVLSMTSEAGLLVKLLDEKTRNIPWIFFWNSFKSDVFLRPTVVDSSGTRELWTQTCRKSSMSSSLQAETVKAPHSVGPKSSKQEVNVCRWMAAALQQWEVTSLYAAMSNDASWKSLFAKSAKPAELKCTLSSATTSLYILSDSTSIFLYLQIEYQ